MTCTSNKHKVLKDKSVWNALSEEEEKMLALEAKVTKLQQNKKNNNKKENGNNQSKSKFRKNEKLPDWFKQKPATNNLNKPRKHNGKLWHWCGKETGGKHHSIYHCHKLDQCKGLTKNAAAPANKLGTGDEAPKAEAPKKNKKVRLAQATKALEILALKEKEE